jgi:hypothetical protein
MRPILDPALLRPGDIVVYRPFELLGWAISLRTGHRWSHVEVVEVPGVSTLTARADRGVNRYRWDWPKPGIALRPPSGFSWSDALAYFQKVKGQPYAFWALLSFATPDPVTLVGQQFCSQFAANFYAAGGVPLFEDFPAGLVPPHYFVTRAEGFSVVWSDAA